MGVRHAISALVFGLTVGEIVFILFILFMVVSAPWWPKLGEAVATRLGGESKR